MDAGGGGKPPAEVRTPKRTGNTVIDFLGIKSLDKGGSDLEVEELSISSNHDKQDISDSRTGSEADTAAGKDSHTNSCEDDSFNEMDRRHTNKIGNVQTFLDTLHNETCPSPVAMQMAYQDLKEQITQAVEEGAQKISTSDYSDDLIHCLRKEKESVAELIEYMNDLTTVFQDQLREVGKTREGQEGAEVTMEDVRGGGNGGGKDKAEGTEWEEEFKGAKETGSITSNTSKIQWAAVDSQTGTATSDVPHPQVGEGGHHVPAAVGHGDG